ncbi:response regulator transcription factor [Clostridium sp.]|uniref:response regulator transcription factor n=1 Tax=Clostridium sp. TaxID=1506 RepID=UPI0025C21597|nr:response regulator transcription factor [Clostridium sp.]MCI9069980.1 response regulator transcription factor [Clostridium sp.]MCI9303968.1 response regulator transcription factor [Clostridium sp.]
MKKILIIEDDLNVARELSISLKKWSFEVDIIKNFDNILKEVIYNKPSLILMDVNLPYYDGFYWCEKIREVSKVPIIFLSSRDSNMDIIMGINNGGDDYITKPFSTEVLISKINALLRRSYDYNNSDTLIYYNDAVLDIEKCIFRYDDKEIELTKNEIKILSLLIKNKEKVVSREKIMMSLWNDDEFVNDNTLTVNITRLRGKINELGLKDIIKTKKGIGYLIK